MKISVIGLGYVGLVTAAVLSDQGHNINGVDVDENKIRMLEEGRMPIYEPGLDNLIEKNRDHISFNTDYSNVGESDLVFVCVPTPDGENGIDLKYVMAACSSIRDCNQQATVVIKSTVTPGTAAKVRSATGLTVVSNPEFLREGYAIEDSVNASRIVVGSHDQGKARLVADLWSFTKAPEVVTNNENAELIKYASNAFLAVKISFINEMANLCETIPGADVNIVAEGMGFDDRIGNRFLKAGIGFGGSCFPKDTRAIVADATSRGVDLSIIKKAISVNDTRITHVLDRVGKRIGGFNNKKIAVLGASFKENTDDLRFSKSWELIEELKKSQAEITVYDPVVRNLEGVRVANTIEEAVSDSDVVMVATEWEMFREADLSKARYLIDLRGILDNGVADLKVGVYDQSA